MECGANGKVYWQERSIAKATFVWADQKLITLDQDGNLMLAQPSPEGSRCCRKPKLLTNLSWTPPDACGNAAIVNAPPQDSDLVDLG